MRFWDDRVLYIDGEAIVIDKPAGLAVHPGARTRESLEDFLHQLRFGFHRLPLPVHRLDRDTSGCLLLARNPKAHKAFQRAFEAKQVEKSYVAVLDAVPEAESGTVDMILAIGAGEKRPYVVNDSLQIATVMSATGSFDHRAIDGADGARLMQAFKRLIENPLGMLA